jgi:hypothetical protein
MAKSSPSRFGVKSLQTLDNQETQGLESLTPIHIKSPKVCFIFGASGLTLSVQLRLHLAECYR